ncbi:Vegetative protein 296 [Candidatus Entotheonellaceae bacterium PAL068K]
MATELMIRNLRVNVAGKPILRGLNLDIKQGEIHVLMGPNGSGKSTLAYALMGHPKYQIEAGEILLNGEDLLGTDADERARKGLFLAFQYPVSIPGVTLASFLRSALSAVRRGQNGAPAEDTANGKKKELLIPMRQFRKELLQRMKELGVDQAFARRYLNDGFSGGEKKRVEVLQLAMLNPQIAILDETDSGLDIDALRTVAEGLNKLVGPQLGVLLITHYQRLLNYITPHFVHILLDGQLVESGGPELAEKLEEHGYDWVREKHPEPVR